MVRILVIGMGKMGLLHSSILNTFDDVEFIGFVDDNKLIRNTFKTLKPEWQITNNYKELINSEKLDAVFITTPISTHLEIIKCCIDKNIAFFVEKPAFASIEQTNLIKTSLSNYKAPSLVGYMMRYINTFSKGKEIIENNIICRVRSFEGTMYISQLFKKGKGWRYDPQISGGGVIIHQTCHVLDLINWYLGYPNKIAATSNKWFSEHVEDHAHIIYEYENNCAGWIDSTWSRYNHRMLMTKLHFEGEYGTLTVDDDSVKLYLNRDEDHYQKGWTEFNKIQFNKGVEIDFGAPYYSIQNRDFVNILQGNNSMINNVHDIHESINLQSIFHHIYYSINNKSQLLPLELDNEK